MLLGIAGYCWLLQGAAGYCCLVLLGAAFGSLGTLLGSHGLPWDSLKLFWGSLGALLGCYVSFRVLVGLSWALLELSWASLGLCWGPPGLRPKRPPEAPQRPPQEGSKSHLPEVCFRGLFLTPFWEAFWGSFGSYVGSRFLCIFGARFCVAVLLDYCPNFRVFSGTFVVYTFFAVLLSQNHENRRRSRAKC